MRKVIISFVVAIFLVATVGANAQNSAKSPLPKEKVGLGVKVNDINLGVSFAYALKENFHIGSTLPLVTKVVLIHLVMMGELFC